MQLRLLFISILIAFSASTVTALPYGAYVVNDVTAYNDCPLCNSGDILTGSICTCPALATSIQNFRILNDCGAPHSLYRGAFIGLVGIPRSGIPREGCESPGAESPGPKVTMSTGGKTPGKGSADSRNPPGGNLHRRKGQSPPVGNPRKGE